MLRSNTTMTPSTKQNISVIICAYTEDRWNELVAAVKSVRQQTVAPKEIIVVIDHNPNLLERVKTHIPGVTVVANRDLQGLSGARNTGIAIAQGDVIAFMDEDAVAETDWLMQLSKEYEDPFVLGVGGVIEPVWEKYADWFPEEFNWIVGCTYRGMPQASTPVRNLIGCNMSIRRDVFEAVDGFRNGIGRVGTRPVGCEETELCIRAGQHFEQGIFLYQPQAQVHHHVPAARTSWHYFRSRCYAEGLSKALVARFVGARDGLASERTYTFKTLPLGVIQGLKDSWQHHNLTGLARAGAIVTGLALTTMGYLAGSFFERSRQMKETISLKEIMVHLRKKTETFNAGPKVPDFKPARMLEVELSQPLPAVPAFDAKTNRSYDRAVSLVRLHTQPLGIVELQLNDDGLSSAEYANQIWDALSSEIVEHLQQDSLPMITELGAVGLSDNGFFKCTQKYSTPVSNLPFASIVIATRDRPDSLTVCLDSLLTLDYPDYEIIVVDNAPATNATFDLIKQKYSAENIHYIREDRPGLACAHNRGLMEVKASIVAFTDDDVVVDKHWLTKLVAGFYVTENVACVTGMIFPAELETPAQGWIEQYGGFNKGFTRRIFDLSENRPESPLYPYTAGIFGSGASMAFSTSALRDMDGFDSALGAGSAALGGDDLAVFFEVVTRGYRLVYEPAAIVHHWHRRDYAGLRRQAYGYGVGLTAYLMKTLVDRPARFFEFVVKIPYGLVYTLSSQSPKNIKKLADYPKELTSLERKGMLYGIFAYLHSRWQIRGIQPQAGLIKSSAASSLSPTSLADEVS